MKVPEQQPMMERGREYGPTLDYGSPYQQGQATPRARPSSIYERDAQRISEAKQALWKAQISGAPSRYVTTPYMSRTEGAAWHPKQEESSPPQHSEHGRSDRQNPAPERFARKEQTDVQVRPSLRNLSERLGHRGDRQ